VRLTRLYQKLVAGVVGLFLLPGLLAAGLLIALYRWGAFSDAFTLLVTVVVGLAAMMGYLGLIAHTIGRGLVGAIRQMQLGTELIATVNPAHRLDISTGDELEGLAREINHLAERMVAARQDGARAATALIAELQAERARLASVLEALGEAVLVITPEGRISLANGAALVLLGAGLLGRELAEVVADTGPVLDAAAGFRAGASAAEHLTLQTRDARGLETVVAPLREPDGRMAALVIILRGIPPDGAGPGGGAPSARSRGAGLVSGVSRGEASEECATLYDFTLLAEVERHVGSRDKDLPLESLTATVLDVETTGLDLADDRIVSIACVRIRKGVVRRGELLDVVVNPERPIPQSSARIHGITDAMVARAPALAAVLPGILQFAENTVLVGHHVWFDLGFLGRVTEGLGLPHLTRTHAVLDTRMLSEIVHGSLVRHDLDTVCLRLGVAAPGRHSALGDALATAEILMRLVDLLGRREIRTVGDALQAMRRLRARRASYQA
jgi:DNA polymerase-3 subunit epsilon